jgi:hypothetical protein
MSGSTGNLPVPVGNLPTGSTMVNIPSGQSHHATPAPPQPIEIQ